MDVIVTQGKHNLGAVYSVGHCINTIEQYNQRYKKASCYWDPQGGTIEAWGGSGHFAQEMQCIEEPRTQS